MQQSNNDVRRIHLAPERMLIIFTSLVKREVMNAWVAYAEKLIFFTAAPTC